MRTGNLRFVAWPPRKLQLKRWQHALKHEMFTRAVLRPAPFERFENTDPGRQMENNNSVLSGMRKTWFQTLKPNPIPRALPVQRDQPL